MRPKSKTLSATGATPWLPVNHNQESFNIGIQVVISGGASLTWVIETTSDDVFDTSITPTAIVAAAPLDTGTGNETGVLTVPVRAIRMSATIAGGTVTMTMVQGA